MKTDVRKYGRTCRFASAFVICFIPLFISAFVFSAEEKEINPSEIQETVTGDIVADAMRNMFAADVALINAGSLGAAELPEKITEDNLRLIVPFESEVVVTESLKGSDLRAALERSVSMLPRRFSGFLQVSGLRFTCDLNRQPGKRVTEIFIGKGSLKDDKVYTVTTTAFLASGGGGYSSLRKGKILTEEGVPLGGIVLENAVIPKEKTPAGRIKILLPEEKD